MSAGLSENNLVQPAGLLRGPQKVHARQSYSCLENLEVTAKKLVLYITCVLEYWKLSILENFSLTPQTTKPQTPIRNSSYIKISIRAITGNLGGHIKDSLQAGRLHAN